jgi:hypothetical protein
MNRRGTSVALAVAVPGVLAGATAVLAQQGQGQGPPQTPPGQQGRPNVIPATGDLMDKQSGQKVGTFDGQITNAVLSVVEDQGVKKLQLAGRLTGRGTVNNQEAPLGQPVDVTGFLVPEDAAAAPAGAGAGPGAVLSIVAPLAPAAQATVTATPSGTPGAGATPVPAGARCQVLLLQIPGGLTLDLLGLLVTLDALRLDISAIRGAGNLLGNLLCAVVNLLNGVNLAGLLAALPALAGQLGQLGQLLGSLSGSLDDLVGAINDLLGGAAP